MQRMTNSTNELQAIMYKSPIGNIIIKAYENGIVALDYEKSEGDFKCYDNKESYSVLNQAIIQLDEYFKGTRTQFDLNILFDGTDFQKRVWNELLKVPYGETRTYKSIAENLNIPKGARAIGNANHINKIAIIIPCHRVIATNGALSGYAGGVWRKQWLIEHEAKNSNNYNRSKNK